MTKPYVYKGCTIELTNASASVRRGRYGRPERLVGLYRIEGRLQKPDSAPS
jgi:hypothetical protein